MILTEIFSSYKIPLKDFTEITIRTVVVILSQETPPARMLKRYRNKNMN